MPTPKENAFEQLKEQLPTDLVPGYTVASTGTVDPQSDWTDKLQRFSKDMAANAYAYFNYNVSKSGLISNKRKPKRVLSAAGFPPWVTVTYAYPPPMAFYSANIPPEEGYRKVNFFVLHSFGHAWSAMYSRDKKREIGWMNSVGVTAIPFDNKTVYIAKGSDPESMAHWKRFSAGLSACLGSAAEATAHFFIDRDGNLVVIGDCNDVMFTSNCLNKVQIGVEIEEAFYVLKDTKEEPARFRSGGTPRGTAGNVQYFAYSPQQMLTLSILVKKLELAYPKTLTQRNIHFSTKNVTPKSAPGYCMHDTITGASHFDVSPHFLTQDLWDAFFNLVDSHTHITSAHLWKPSTKYEDSGQSVMIDPVANGDVTAMTQKLLELAQTQGIALTRTNVVANMSRTEINNNAGNQATNRAHTELQKVADITCESQQTQDPAIDTPSLEQAVDDEGQQVCSDDIW